MTDTEQPSLFPAVRRTDPDTSHAAAASITPGRCENVIIELMVHAALTDDGMFPGEFTDDEIAARLPHLYPPTVKSARSRLTKAGTLTDTGRRASSNRGRAMIVWKLT